MATHRINVDARNVDHWSWSLDGGPDNMMPSGSTFADITIGEASSSTSIQNMSWMDRAAMSPADGYFYNYNDRHWGPAFPISGQQWVITYGGPETKIAFFEDKLTAIYLNDTGETSVDYATLQAYWNSVTSLKVVWAYFPGYTDHSSAEPNRLRNKAANYTGIKIGGVDTGITGATLVDGGWQYSHNTLPGATSGTPGYPTTEPWTNAWGTSYTGLPSELRLFYSDNQEFDIPIPAGNTTWLRNATSLQSGWGTNNFSAMAYYNLDLEYPILGTSFGGEEETEYYYVAGIIPVLVGYTRS